VKLLQSYTFKYWLTSPRVGNPGLKLANTFGVKITRKNETL